MPMMAQSPVNNNTYSNNYNNNNEDNLPWLFAALSPPRSLTKCSKDTS